ncbi:hypothetical protein CRENPOLYSF1_90031 [Crenothrix polyspora]|uniref:Uncharacterized protein n=1 Tax=Crenothrix polyspora TaxID=360316 RepID=A0A1R4HJM2_9GAMM|nr:hypothetical protein CRENPOLYSF1_90031 [Crenothrix polyspora]
MKDKAFVYITLITPNGDRALSDYQAKPDLQRQSTYIYQTINAN